MPLICGAEFGGGGGGGTGSGGGVTATGGGALAVVAFELLVPLQAAIAPIASTQKLARIAVFRPLFIAWLSECSVCAPVLGQRSVRAAVAMNTRPAWRL